MSRNFLDPRFLGGVFLIVLAVVGAVLVLRSAHTGITVYQARSDLAAGTTVSASDFATTEVNVPGGAYLPVGHLGESRRLTRSLAKGELLPKAAVEGEDDLHPLVVPLAQPVASSVRAGDAVTLWAAPPKREGAGGARALTNAAIYVAPATSGVAGTRTTAVELRIPSADLASVVEAIAAKEPLLAVAGTR